MLLFSGQSPQIKDSKFLKIFEFGEDWKGCSLRKGIDWLAKRSPSLEHKNKHTDDDVKHYQKILTRFIVCMKPSDTKKIEDLMDKSRSHDDRRLPKYVVDLVNEWQKVFC